MQWWHFTPNTSQMAFKCTLNDLVDQCHLFIGRRGFFEAGRAFEKSKWMTRCEDIVERNSFARLWKRPALKIFLIILGSVSRRSFDVNCCWAEGGGVSLTRIFLILFLFLRFETTGTLPSRWFFSAPSVNRGFHNARVVLFADSRRTRLS